MMVAGNLQNKCCFTIIRSVVVSLETQKHTVDKGIEILPWQDFLEELWAGQLIE